MHHPPSPIETSLPLAERVMHYSDEFFNLIHQPLTDEVKARVDEIESIGQALYDDCEEQQRDELHMHFFSLFKQMHFYRYMEKYDFDAAKLSLNL